MSDKKIFISYSRKDKDLVFDIVRQIEDKVGVKCWIDVNGIESGQQFVDVIMGAIENCEVVLFMMSDSSLKSEYARKEVNYANLMKKRIVPVILDGDKLRGWFAFDFSLTDFIVASNPDDISKLMRDLRSWLGTGVSHTSSEADAPTLASFSTSNKPSANEVNLKVMSNLDCKVIIDCEEKVTADANRLVKIPLPVGEYYAEFISTENPVDAIAREIVLEHDKLEKVDLLSLKQAREKSEAEQAESERLARIESMTLVPYISNNKVGFADLETREIIIPCKYDHAREFSEGLSCVCLNGKWGFIDKVGREVVPYRYDDAYPFTEGMAIVKMNGKYGYIDKSGREVVPCRYDHAYPFTEGMAIVKMNGKYGYIDKSGREVVPCRYDDASYLYEGFAKVRINGKWGYIDRSGEVVPCRYDDASDFCEGMARVEMNGKYGYIDISGREVVPCRYDDAYDFREGFASVKMDGKWGYINRLGREVVPCRYNSAIVAWGGFIVKMNGKEGYIDRFGNEMWSED